MKSPFTLLAIGLAVGAPGYAAQTGEWEGTVTDSAGVRIVANSNRGVWAPGDEWTVVEELKIGSLDEPNYRFGEIASIAVGKDGAMYVLDAQAQAVFVYHASGRFVRTIGRAGAGPGEIGAGPPLVVMGAGDTLLVADPINTRINLYRTGGASIGSGPTTVPPPIAWRGTSSGVVARQLRGDPTAPNPTDVVELIHLDGSVGDTLLQFASGGTFAVRGGQPAYTILAAEPFWAIADQRAVYSAVNDEYRISKHSDGQLTHVITKPSERHAIGARDRDMMIEAFLDAVRFAGAPPEALEMARQLIRFPETYPVFARLAAGPAGTLWVQHQRDLGSLTSAEREQFRVNLNIIQRGGVDYFEDAGAPEWDVFDSAGRFLGVVTMPDRFTPLLFVGSSVYGVWRDDLDVQYVVRARIEGER